MRKLTASEVTFEVTIEAEDMPIRGHFASGDEELDRADEQAICERLDRGDIEAWCCVVVTATWEAPDGTEYVGRDTLGGCSLDDSYTREVVAEEHGMQEQALDDLNQRIACKLASARRLAAALGAS